MRSLVKSGDIDYYQVLDEGVASLSRDLCGFAVELRNMAYTMPAGHEDALIRLSERMVRHAQERAADGRVYRTE